MQSITTRGTDNLKTGFSLTAGAFLIIVDTLAAKTLFVAGDSSLAGT